MLYNTYTQLVHRTQSLNKDSSTKVQSALASCQDGDGCSIRCTMCTHAIQHTYITYVYRCTDQQLYIISKWLQWVPHWSQNCTTLFPMHLHSDTQSLHTNISSHTLNFLQQYVLYKFTFYLFTHFLLSYILTLLLTEHHFRGTNAVMHHRLKQSQGDYSPEFWNYAYPCVSLT